MHWFLPTLHRDKSTSWIPMFFSYWGNAAQSKRHEAHYNVSPCFYFSSTFLGNVLFVGAWKWDIFVMRFFLAPPAFALSYTRPDCLSCRGVCWVNLFTVHNDAEVYSITVNACRFLGFSCYFILKLRNLRTVSSFLWN